MLLLLKKQKYNLTEDGFSILGKVFSKKETKSAYTGLSEVIMGKYNTGKNPERRFWNVGDDPNAIIKIDKPHLSNRSVWNLITNRKFGEALASITNSRKIQVWHTQVVWKPKSKLSSGNAGWHRDAQYWPFWSKQGLYTAWVALSNVSIRSGPVQFIIGSNHWDSLSGLDFFNQDLESQNKILKKHNHQKKTISAILKQGQVSVHSSLTYHSSSANEEENPRVGMVVHFCTEKAKQIAIKGENKNYLNQLKNPGICPVIYGK